MQTFLPFPSFRLSAETLDYKRLGKQRVEAKQILTALSDSSYGWRSHPATIQWRGYENALALYGFIVCQQWISRGYSDSLLGWFATRITDTRLEMPRWLGQQDYHISHRSNLIRKYPAYYRSKFPGVPDNLPYVWPSRIFSAEENVF